MASTSSNVMGIRFSPRNLDPFFGNQDIIFQTDTSEVLVFSISSKFKEIGV